MTTIPFGPWEPDKGPLNPDTVNVVSNLNPLVNGWGPFPSLQGIGLAIGATVIGSWKVRKADGTINQIAATSDDLFIYNTATQAWDNISGGSAPYNVPDGQFPQAVQFGTKFIVVSLDAPPQVYDVEAGGTFADLAGSPPKAKFIWIAGDFVVLGYLKDGATEAPQDIHWSGINDCTYWTIDRKKGSDRQTLPDGDEIMGGFGFPGGARIIQRNAKRAMLFSGDQYIFNVKAIDPTRGAAAPYSIVPISANDYVFWRTDGIYRGDDNTPIGAQRVDNTLLNQINGLLDITELDTVQGVADPYNKVVMWTYVTSSSTRAIIAWDWELDRFFPLSIEALLLFSSATPGLSLDAADEFADDIDAVGAPSLDSRIYKGGAPLIGVFGASGIAQYFGGPAMAGLIETATLELTPEQRSFVNGAKVKGNPSSGTTLQVLKGDLPDATLTVSAAVSRSARTGVYPVRADAFFHRFRVNTAAGDTSFTHLHGVAPMGAFSGEA